MVKKVEGCTHLIIKDGVIVNVATHLNKLPKNGVVHLKVDKIYTIKEFKKSHLRDHHELKKQKKKINIGQF